MSVDDRQRAKAEWFLELHDDEEILVLPNAWDAASARLFAAAGARAIGSTSMGIAASHGYADVQRIPFDIMLTAVGEIVRAVDLPVTADMESGWGATPTEVVPFIERVVECGVVGVNLEDGTGNPTRPLVEPSVLADKISAVREAMNAAGFPLVINARTDVYLSAVGSPHGRIDEVVRRARIYHEAGCDCVFVPGGLSRSVISALVQALDMPLNILANPATSAPVVPPIDDLEELGVARVSVGSGPLRATLAFTKKVAEELCRSGTYTTMSAALQEPTAPEAYRTAIGEREA